MRVVILNGSPRKGANTEVMANAFADEARACGHDAEVVNVGLMDIHGCLGCQYCFAHEGACVQKDDMAGVLEKLREADVVVFASPIYWFDITAQEKAAIDRLYAFGGVGFPFHRVALLLDSASDGVYTAAISQYNDTCAYCKWESLGVVCVPGMEGRDSMASSPKLAEVRELAHRI